MKRLIRFALLAAAAAGARALARRRIKPPAEGVWQDATPKQMPTTDPPPRDPSDPT